MRKGIADFTRQRSLVRSQQRPLTKPLSLQVKREAKLTRLESLLVGVEFAFRRSPFT